MTNNAEKSLTIISSVSKSGNRFVIGVPKKLEDRITPLAGVPVRVTIEALV